MGARYRAALSVGAVRTFEGVGPNREVHVAFTAPDAATVRAWHAEAVCHAGDS
jgi:hypothetical protein